MQSKGGGTKFPVFIARLFLPEAATCRGSAGLLFGDLRKAYYSVLLEIGMGPFLTEGEREALL